VNDRQTVIMSNSTVAERDKKKQYKRTIHGTPTEMQYCRLTVI